MRQGILNVRATVVASLAFAGLVASIPTQALELYNNSSKVCDFSTFNFDGARLNVACGSGTPATKACMTSTSTGSFSVESPATDHTQVGTSTTTTRKVRFNRGGTCVGAYDLYYNIAAVNLTGWSFNGGTTNGKVHFNEGDEYVDVDFLPGSSEGWFLVQLSPGTSTAIPVPPAPTVTVAKQDWWMDIKNGVVTQPQQPQQPGGTIPAGCTDTGTPIVEDITSAIKYEFALKTGQTKAFSFTMPQSVPDYSKAVTLTTYEVSGLVYADHEIVVSACPGDFSRQTNVCAAAMPGVGSSFTMGTTDYNRGNCNLQGGKKYYINTRFIKNSNDLTNYCSADASASYTCHNYVSITVPQ